MQYYSRPLIGFRMWRVGAGRLLPLSSRQATWETQAATEARCLYWSRPLANGKPLASPHPAPQAGCTCGLYAYHRPEDVFPLHYGNRHHIFPVAGAMIGWGKVEVHHDGFRAQFARPALLCLSGDQLLNQRIIELARRYGVSTVAREDLQAEALAYGASLPEDNIPPSPTPFAPCRLLSDD